MSPVVASNSLTRDPQRQEAQPMARDEETHTTTGEPGNRDLDDDAVDGVVAAGGAAAAAVSSLADKMAGTSVVVAVKDNWTEGHQLFNRRDAGRDTGREEEIDTQSHADTVCHSVADEKNRQKQGKRITSGIQTRVHSRSSS